MIISFFLFFFPLLRRGFSKHRRGHRGLLFLYFFSLSFFFFFTFFFSPSSPLRRSSRLQKRRARVGGCQRRNDTAAFDAFDIVAARLGFERDSLSVYTCTCYRAVGSDGLSVEGILPARCRACPPKRYRALKHSTRRGRSGGGGLSKNLSDKSRVPAPTRLSSPASLLSARGEEKYK